MYPTATELPVRAYDNVNESTKNAQQDAMLNPRFYTTDFAKIDALRIKPEHQQMWDDILAEFRRDPNKNHFKRNEEFDADFATMDPKLREQFIAVLGHDLRTPLGSIMLGTELLLGEPLSPKAASVVARMRRSADRMAALAQRDGIDTLITCGGVQSNHCRATAALGALPLSGARAQAASTPSPLAAKK